MAAACVPGGQPCPPPGTIKPGFTPNKSVGTTAFGQPHGKPLIADLGLTPGHKSVVFGNAGGQLWIVKYDGTVPPGMPLTLPADVYSTPAVGDLDGDGLPDIVVGYGSTLDTTHPGGFRAYKNHGPGAAFTQLWDRPTGDLSAPFGVLDPVMSSPAIGDVDGDGIVEVAVGGLDENIYLVDGRTGFDKPGWPKRNLDTVFSSPALFDLNGDGKLEVIIGGDRNGLGGQIHAFRPDGSELPGFPIFTDQAMSSSPAIGDIDGDGKPEIVIGTGSFFPGRAHKVYAFHCDGSPVLNWPVSVDGQVVNAPVLADLDGDGVPEVVVTDDNSGPTRAFHVYAFRGTGSPFWSQLTGQPVGGRQPKDFFGATLSAGDPVVADVLNGAEPEVLVPTNGEVCVFSNTGLQLTDNGTHPAGGFSFFTSGSVSGVAVDDFESDGALVEVVALAADPVNTKTDVYVWNPKATGVIPWGQFRHDERHSGVVSGTPTCAPRAVVATTFHTLTPCRVVDTRLATAPPGLGPPALQALGSPANPRHFTVLNDVCGIPASAVSISANLTVTNVGAQGELVVYPVGVSLPRTSSISFRPGKTQANNTLVYLSETGAIFTVFNNCIAPVDFILDVNGYFQ